MAWACDDNHESIVKMLIEARANVNLSNNFGLSPLHKACSRGLESVAKLLIESNADINALDEIE